MKGACGPLAGDTPRIGTKRQIGSRNSWENAKRQVWNTTLKRAAAVMGRIHVCDARVAPCDDPEYQMVVPGDIQRRHVLRIVGHATDVVRVDIPPTSGGYIIWEEDMLNATGAGELTEVHPWHSQASLSLYGGESLLNVIELTDIVRKAHLLEGPVQHM